MGQVLPFQPSLLVGSAPFIGGAFRYLSVPFIFLVSFSFLCLLFFCFCFSDFVLIRSLFWPSSSLFHSVFAPKSGMPWELIAYTASANHKQFTILNI